MLVAKVLLFGVIAFIVGEAVSFVAFVIGIMSCRARRSPSGSRTRRSSEPLRAAGLYLTALGLFALGLATNIRYTAATISTFVAALFILPIIADVLP